MRFGYRRLAGLLLLEDWLVHAKQAYLLYKEEWLIFRTKLRKKNARRRLLELELAKADNQHWSIDLVAARLKNRGPFRILTMVDQFTRECVYT